MRRQQHNSLSFSRNKFQIAFSCREIFEFPGRAVLQYTQIVNVKHIGKLGLTPPSE